MKATSPHALSVRTVRLTRARRRGTATRYPVILSNQPAPCGSNQCHGRPPQWLCQFVTCYASICGGPLREAFQEALLLITTDQPHSEKVKMMYGSTKVSLAGAKGRHWGAKGVAVVWHLSFSGDLDLPSTISPLAAKSYYLAPFLKWECGFADGDLGMDDGEISPHHKATVAFVQCLALSWQCCSCRLKLKPVRAYVRTDTRPAVTCSLHTSSHLPASSHSPPQPENRTLIGLSQVWGHSPNLGQIKGGVLVGVRWRTGVSTPELSLLNFITITAH
ncbi:unnamed protein product [Leuciscus chuanchicus]